MSVELYMLATTDDSTVALWEIIIVIKLASLLAQKSKFTLQSHTHTIFGALFRCLCPIV